MNARPSKFKLSFFLSMTSICPETASRIIGFTGKLRSGKSTAAQLLYDAWPYAKAYKYSFAEPLKQAVGAAFDLDDDQLHDEKMKEQIDDRYGVTPRKMLQKIGTEWFRDRLQQDVGVQFRYPGGLWINRFFQFVEEHPRASLIIIDDVRFPDEAEAIRACNGVLIRIEGPEDQDGAAVPSHASEKGDFPVNATLVNEKTSKLRLLSDVLEVVTGYE